MGDTTLHVIPGSHLEPWKDAWDWADAVEVSIPRGWGILFSGMLVHSGASFRYVNGRIHVYLRARDAGATFRGEFSQCVEVGTPPSPKKTGSS